VRVWDCLKVQVLLPKQCYKIGTVRYDDHAIIRGFGFLQADAIHRASGWGCVRPERKKIHA
jgi:hypothetical protein